MNPFKKPFWAAIVLASIATPALRAQDISHRKADLTVEVRSPSGVPLEGASVEVEMLNHAFRFGTAVTAAKLEPENGEYDQWTAENIGKYCNSVTFGNIMKWTYYEARTPERMLEILRHAQAYKAFDGPDQMRVRGHVTIWGSAYQIPLDVRNSNDGTYIHNRIIEHIESYHTTFKDQGIDNFDLYNEHFNVPQLLVDKIADPNNMPAQAAEVATWFKKAKEVDPNAFLYINDFNVLNDWNGDDRRVVAYKAFIDAIRDAGGPVDGIGLQAHMDRPTTTKADVKRRLDLLAAPMAPTANYPNGLPGLRIEITELDMSSRNRFFNNTWGWPNPTVEQEVAVTEAVLTASFEHPSVDGVTMWGMNDYHHWRGNAILYDDMSDTDTGETRTRIDPVLKETGQLWIDKVSGEWWENHSGASATNGHYTANTFKGTHKVTVTFNGETKEAIAHLNADDTLTFEFAATAADASTYEAWTAFIDWQSADSTRAADPDLDGINNLEEFIAGTNPLAKDYAREPRILSLDGKTFSLAYSVRAANSGLSIEISQSPDLVEWTGVPITEQALMPTIANGIASYLVPIPDSNEDLFYRVTVNEKAD